MFAWLRMRFLLAAGLAAAATIAAVDACAQTNAPATMQACPANAQGIQQTIECACTALEMQSAQPVWGTDVYTDDSHICSAARHAGVIGANGGSVRVTPQGGLQSFPGSTRNGVTTQTFGPWQRAYTVAAGETKSALDPNQCPSNFQGFSGRSQVVTCTCSADQTTQGTAWGTDVYTDDSSICRAAVHAGAIPPTGGSVRVQPAPGRQSYAGSARNGVTTENYGSWPNAFSFAR
jgi:hypothetical protein